MNPLNYATLEASKRLVEAGIVRETDKVWRVPNDFSSPFLTDCEPMRYYSDLPAPSMAEVWRELPDCIDKCQGSVLCLEKIVRDDDGVMIMSASYDYEDVDMGRCTYKFFASANPTDALIDLLIWVRKELKP